MVHFFPCSLVEWLQAGKQISIDGKSVYTNLMNVRPFFIAQQMQQHPTIVTYIILNRRTVNDRADALAAS